METDLPAGGAGAGTNRSSVDVVVRPARPEDLRSFLGLYRRVAAEGRFIRTEAFHEGRRRQFRRQFQRSWTDEDASLIASAGGRVVGHLHIAREEHPVNRHVASFGMMVAADLRGMGIGSNLVAEGLRWARQAGVEKVSLTVYPDNDAALRLYRRFGFVQEGVLTGHSKKRIGYRDEIVMGLWLIPRPDGSGGTT